MFCHLFFFYFLLYFIEFLCVFFFVVYSMTISRFFKNFIAKFYLIDKIAAFDEKFNRDDDVKFFSFFVFGIVKNFQKVNSSKKIELVDIFNKQTFDVTIFRETSIRLIFNRRSIDWKFFMTRLFYEKLSSRLNLILNIVWLFHIFLNLLFLRLFFLELTSNSLYLSRRKQQFRQNSKFWKIQNWSKQMKKFEFSFRKSSKILKFLIILSIRFLFGVFLRIAVWKSNLFFKIFVLLISSKKKSKSKSKRKSKRNLINRFAKKKTKW